MQGAVAFETASAKMKESQAGAAGGKGATQADSDKPTPEIVHAVNVAVKWRSRKQAGDHPKIHTGEGEAGAPAPATGREVETERQDTETTERRQGGQEIERESEREKMQLAAGQTDKPSSSKLRRKSQTLRRG
jgi:hypothetical protein